MPTLVAVAGLGQQTHAGLNTGGTQTKYFDTGNGTSGTQWQVVADSDFGSGYALELIGTAAASAQGFFNASNNGVLGSSGTLVGSFKFKFPSLPSADFDILRIIGTGGGNDAILKYLTSTTGLQGILGASTQLGSTVAASTLVKVDFKAVLNSGSQTLDWMINGVAQTQVTLSATTQNLFKAVFGNDAGSQNGTVRVGDIVLSLTAADYPLGSHKVVLLKVDPSGTITFGGSATSTDWRTFAGATPTLTAWNATTARDAIDEVPPNLTSSQDGLCLITDVPTNTWYVEIPMTTYTLGSGETIAGARSVVCGWQATTSGANCGLRSWNGTTERTLVNTSTSFTTLGNNSATPGWLCKMLTLADIDTQTELDALALRWGFSTDASPDIGIQAAYVEVAIKESTSTPVGKSLQLVWDTRASLGDTVQLVWDVRAAIADTVQLVWDARAVLGDTAQLIWDTRAALGDPLGLIWDIRATVGDSVELLWDVQTQSTPVGKGLALLWDVRAAVGDPVQLVWDTRAALADTLQVIWDVRSSVSDTVQLVWSARATAGDSLDLQWDTRAALGDTLQLLWDVEAIGITAVGKNLSLLWNLKAASGRDLQLAWDARTTAAALLQLQWAVRTTVGKSGQYLWAVHSVAGDQLVLLWNVASLADVAAPETPVDSTVEPGGTTMTEPDTLISVIESNTLVSSVRS